MKKIKNKKTFIFNLLLFLGIIIYAIFNSDILNDLDKNKAFVSNVNTTSKVDFSSDDNLKVYFIDQTTPNMIQRISEIFERKTLISKEI